MFSIRIFRFLAILAMVTGLTATFGAGQAQAQTQRGDYLLGPGDVIRIQVFQSTDLTVEARISESGVISYPLLGVVISLAYEQMFVRLAAQEVDIRVVGLLV